VAEKATGAGEENPLVPQLGWGRLRLRNRLGEYRRKLEELEGNEGLSTHVTGDMTPQTATAARSLSLKSQSLKVNERSF
jgi:hypothetical protein